MPSTPENEAIKQAARRDLGFLKEVLSLQVNAEHHNNSPCPICKDKTCLAFGPEKKQNGEWWWNCNKGCGGGDVIAAIQAVEHKSFKEAFAVLRRRYGGNSAVRKKYDEERAREIHDKIPEAPQYAYSAEKPEPVLDMKRAEEFVDRQHQFLLKNQNIPTHYKRGLSMDVIKKYRIGFVENEYMKFNPWQLRGALIMAAWVIPITDQYGTLKAVRLHHEVRSEKMPKTMWAPFGTKPAYERNAGGEVTIKPVHSYYGFFPHPQTLRRADSTEFSMSTDWWLQRIPVHMKARFDRAVETAALTLAPDIGKLPENFSASEKYQAQVAAYRTMSQDVMTAVLKGAKAETNGFADYSNYTLICAGELKALAGESAGYMATAPTGGDAWTPSQAWFEQFRGKSVCCMFDDDPPKKIEETGKIICSGLDWAKKYGTLLLKHGAARVIAKSGGKRDKA